MYQKCKVVMLPTDKKADENTLYLQNRVLKISFGAITKAINNNYSFNTNTAKHQHLYILSDDEIKEGDWYWFIDGTRQFIVNALFNIDSDKWHKKIIASTNFSLVTSKNICDGCDANIKLINDYHIEGNAKSKHIETNLPFIPQLFIDLYVSEYNKGNVITEIMVEYTDCELDYIKSWYPVCNSNNTINIKSIKNSWNREDLNKEAMIFYNKYHGILNQSDMQSIAKFIQEL